jgi:hypothetical protein
LVLSRAPGLSSAISWSVTAILLAIAGVEFVGNPNLHALPWSHRGLERLGIFVATFLVIAAIRRTPAWFLAIALVYGIGAVGLAPFAAIALFGAAALALGSFFSSEIGIAFCLGEGLLGIAASLLGRTYLCYPVTFLCLLLLPIVLRRRWLVCAARQVPDVLRKASDTAFVVILAFVLGIPFLLAMKPEVGTDSLAMHLALPAYVAMHHHFSFDVREFLWAAMPQTTDWCYAIAYSLGGEFAARLLNFVNLVVAVALLFGIAREFASRRAALAICALFATGPMVQVVAGSLFIDNLLAALLLASLAAFSSQRFAAGWLLLGLALSCKAGAVVFVPGILVFAVYCARGPRASWVAWAVAPALAIGLYYYAAAWFQTGNPVFPYANEIFHSKLLDTSVVAGEFRQPPGWRTPFDITFRSESFLEGTDGCAGFQYFLLLPAGLIAAFKQKCRVLWWVAAVAVSAFVISFSQIAYLRYVYPELLLLMIPMAPWLDEEDRAGGVRRAAAYGLVALIAVANILFQSASGWYHRDFVWNLMAGRVQADEYLRASAPARIITEVLNRIAPGEPALYCQYDHIAGLAGEAHTTNWHTHVRDGSLLNSREAIAVLEFVNRWKIRYVASPIPEDLDTWPRVLPAFFADFTEPVFTPGRWRLYRVRQEFAGPAGVETARRWIERAPPAEPGIYDDADARIHLAGSWYRDFASDRPLYKTLTRSRTAGDELRFAFAGSGIVYRYASGPDAGIAEVSVDGAAAALVDEYAPSAGYDGRREFAGLAPGVHSITVRVTTRRNPTARDGTISVDGFEVTK